MLIIACHILDICLVSFTVFWYSLLLISHTNFEILLCELCDRTVISRTANFYFSADPQFIKKVIGWINRWFNERKTEWTNGWFKMFSTCITNKAAHISVYTNKVSLLLRINMSKWTVVNVNRSGFAIRHDSAVIKDLILLVMTVESR